jgi:galactokinase
MTGGGFGGCTVSLVKEDKIPDFIEKIGAIYLAKTGIKADFYVAEISDGVHRVV